MEEPITFEHKKLLVRKQTVFSKLSEQEIEELAGLFIQKHYHAGETVVTEGDLVDSFCLIIHGKADVCHIRIKDGKEEIQKLAELGAGQAIGINETGFYSLTGRRTATVIAKTEFVVLELGVPKFHGFALAYPHVSEIMRQNANRVADE